MSGIRRNTTTAHGGPPSFLIVSQYYAPERGAAQVRLEAVVGELRRRGCDVEVLTALPNYPIGRIQEGWTRRMVQVEDEHGVRTIRVWVWAATGSGVGRWVNYLSFAFFALAGVRHASSSDWVFVEYPPLPVAIPIVLWGRLHRRRVIVNVADLWVDASIEVGAVPAWVGAAARRLERWVLRRAHVVNAVTEGVAEGLLEKGLDPAKLRWLPNGVDPALFAPGPEVPGVRMELGVPDHHALVLYAGTHGFVHSLDVVLDAAQELVDLPLTIVLVGDGSEKGRLQRRASEMGLTNVRFIASAPLERVADYLRSAAIGLATVRLGSAYRSVRSAKMLPVMASGVPLIYAASDEGSAIVERVGAGIVTPPGDGAAMALAIRELVADPDRRAEMGRKGRAYAVAEGDWVGIVEAWLGSLGEPGPGGS